MGDNLGTDVVISSQDYTVDEVIKDLLVQLLCSSRLTQSQLPQIMSKLLLDFHKGW